MVQPPTHLARPLKDRQYFFLALDVGEFRIAAITKSIVIFLSFFG
jgi:hypothetical protein